MSTDDETKPAPSMTADQLRSDMDTIRTVLTDRDKENDIHRIIIAAGNFVFGGLALLAIPFLLIPIGIVGLTASPQHPGEPMPVVIVGGVLGIVIFVLILLSLPCLFAGWGVFKKRSWGPTMAVIAGILNLFNIPLGTALATYTFWVVIKGKLPVAPQRT